MVCSMQAWSANITMPMSYADEPNATVTVTEESTLTYSGYWAESETTNPVSVHLVPATGQTLRVTCTQMYGFDTCDAELKVYNGAASISSSLPAGDMGAVAEGKVFESTAADGSLTVAKFIGDFIKRELDNYLHIESQTAEIMLHKIQESEKERKAIAGVTKQTRERAKKASLNNKKLRDCRVHYCDAKGDRRDDTSLFITEGLSATGTITKVRNVETQAVFSLRGKPLNTFGKSQKDIKANEEFYLLDAALDIADGIENLRYNKVIIATDADVDGMHIRLLMITYFLQFYPDLVKKGHVYILQTPLFRVRNKNTSRGKKKVKDETYYCYTDDERVTAINRLGKNAEITRFKGLGEISADEFKDFIGPDMRLDQVKLRKEDSVKEMLEFYMGKNTMERQLFIVDNLVVEDNDNMDMTH